MAGHASNQAPRHEWKFIHKPQPKAVGGKSARNAENFLIGFI